MVRVVVFNATINNISVILWRSVLLVEDTSTRRKPRTCRKALTNSHKVVSSTPRHCTASYKSNYHTIIRSCTTTTAPRFYILLNLFSSWMQGRIQDFKLGGALKKIAPSGGRREKFWGISCEKSRFYAKKKIIFFPILGGRPPPPPPLWIRSSNVTEILCSPYLSNNQSINTKIIF